MELYNTDNVAADIERIKADVEPYWANQLVEGHVKSYEIRAGYVNMNHFWAAVEFISAKEDGERFGPITAHYTILILNGKIVHQNNPL